MAAIDKLPGFRRRFRITPAQDWVSAEVEDDFHHMGVRLRHANGVAAAVEPIMVRVPWTTCPGAMAQLQRTFANIALEAFPERGEKQRNCTHLHDLAVLAAAHAGDAAPTIYDVAASDPVEGRSHLELRRNGDVVLAWEVNHATIESPAELAGTQLRELNPAQVSSDPLMQEMLRVLRWGALIAHGRLIPLEHQSDALSFQSRCYTFQPENAVHARRVGLIKDFSAGAGAPLDQPAVPATD